LRVTRRQLIATSISLITIAVAGIVWARFHRARTNEHNPDSLLGQADALSWNDNWIKAEPLYHYAELLFAQQHRNSKALYAHVSQIPPNSESSSLTSTIFQLTNDLARPEAADPETRLRILTIRGMLETDYDAASARTTWVQVAELARRRGHLQLALRAIGEQGIAAFILGDTATAKKDVLEAWTSAKVLHDPAASVRYASVYGDGLVELRRYKEALTPLDEAIKLAKANPDLAYPSIAVNSKIDALRGLRRYDEALGLSADALAHLPNASLKGHEFQILMSRAEVYEDLNQWSQAVADCNRSLADARLLSYWRGITEAGGFLALAHEHQGQLPEALKAIDEAINANTHIPDELYFVPRNLAIKAEITQKLGNAKGADELYRKSAALIDAMLAHAPTQNVQRYVLAQMGYVYSGFFASLCAQKKYDDAFRVLEQVRGRVETEGLQHHGTIPPHAPTPEELRLTRLNLALIDTNDPKQRAQITDAIYHTELNLDGSSLEGQTATRPITLAQLQDDLSEDDLVVEYVVAEPYSGALAITKTTVRPYTLPGQTTLEADADKYRHELRSQGVDPALGQKLFNELLGPVTELRAKSHLILIPDGSLHLLPFSALVDNGKYLLQTHEVSVTPSSTVLHILKSRASSEHEDQSLPYVGVAAWTQTADSRNFITRAISGPERSELTPLPDSKREVQSIATTLPKPSTILLGDDATKTHFVSLPLARFNVLHLALHGYTDIDYPDRSALVFAPNPSKSDDGLLQVRDIRKMHLNARLVTLSACNTGVGPVGEAGVANLVNAFIEAGADSVVSTLWELEDHSTSRMMTDFYRHVAMHEPEAAALRDAQLELIKNNVPPYYWASFQLVGNPDTTL
jgi:CHAT domain-containing protein/tetratricopeptide (TPR) repeat protein